MAKKRLNIRHIEDAFLTCKKHRDAVSHAKMDIGLSQQIDHYLLRAMVMLMVSQAEIVLEAMFCKKADITGIEEFRCLMASVMDKTFRSPDMSKIVGKLNCLSKVRGGRLTAELKKRPEVSAQWESLMTARHAIVHRTNGGAVTLNWNELDKCYESYLEVLGLVSNALDLTKKEIDEILLAP